MWSGSERGPGGRKPHKDGGGMMKVGGSRQSNGNMHKKKVTLHRFSGDGLKKRILNPMKRMNRVRAEKYLEGDMTW